MTVTDLAKARARRQRDPEPSAPVRAVILDFDNTLVYYRNPDPLGDPEQPVACPGAVELIQTMEQHGVPYLVVSNDSSRGRDGMCARGRAAGLDIPEEKMLTSVEAAMLCAADLYERENPDTTYRVISNDKMLSIFAEAFPGRVIPYTDTTTDADVCVIGEMGGMPGGTLRTKDGEVPNPITAQHFAHWMGNAVRCKQVIGTNPDEGGIRADGSYEPSVGPWLAAYRAIVDPAGNQTHTHPIVAGKPSEYLWGTALGQLNKQLPDGQVPNPITNESVLMVGDNANTDVLFGLRHGGQAAWVPVGDPPDTRTGEQLKAMRIRSLTELLPLVTPQPQPIEAPVIDIQRGPDEAIAPANQAVLRAADRGVPSHLRAKTGATGVGSVRDTERGGQ